MDAKTFFKTVQGIDVFLLESGRFEATIDRKKVTKKSFSEIEREIAKKAGAVKVFSFHGYESSPRRPQEVEIVQFEKDGRARLSDGSLDGRYHSYVTLSETQIAAIEDLVSRSEALDEEFRELLRTVPRVNNNEDLEEIRKQSQTSQT